MSRMICIATPRIKPTRRSVRPDAPFAAGLAIKPSPFGGIVAAPEAFESDEDKYWDALFMERRMEDRLQRGPWL